jgi:hypothetical protein
MSVINATKAYVKREFKPSPLLVFLMFIYDEDAAQVGASQLEPNTVGEKYQWEKEFVSPNAIFSPSAWAWFQGSGVATTHRNIVGKVNMVMQSVDRDQRLKRDVFRKC